MSNSSFTAEPSEYSGFPEHCGPCVVVAGPTASGKSALAISLAQEVNGEIVNADSMQVYRDLSILTARPTDEETQGIPHHLYGVLPPDVMCDAGLWLNWMHSTLPDIWARDRIPVIVGGTGLYLRALMNGLAPVPAVPESVRTKVTKDYNTMGAELFSAYLAEKDPISAAAIPSTNRQRMIRAMEIVDYTGKPLSWWKKQPHRGALPSSPLIVILEPERSWLYARCDARFETMLEAGALEQVRELLLRGLGSEAPVCRGLGTRALMSFLSGNMPRSEAVALAQRETRNYAKRQLTWFRNQVSADIRLFPPQDDLDSPGCLSGLLRQLRHDLNISSS